MGGTLASLRGYIENRGGKAVAAVVMTAGKNSLDIAIKKMLDDINNKHGPLMNQYWQENFGYGIDQLTQSEAGHLRRAASVDEIRDRLVKARHEGIQRLGKKGIETPRSEGENRAEITAALGSSPHRRGTRLMACARRRPGRFILPR